MTTTALESPVETGNAVDRPRAIGAILVLPKLVTSAWDSGRVLVLGIPHEVSHVQVLDIVASIVRLLALALPVAGSVLVTQKIVGSTWGRARSWSTGSPVRLASSARNLASRAGDYVVGATIAVDGGIVYANPGIKGEGWD